MAKESVIYLKVESKFYDDKLKRAVQGMQHFEQQCEATGKSLADADKKTLDYINALGDMGTVATSATGKLNELTKAYTELSVQYQKMSAAEKKSAPGQALAGSLDKLKGRIGELKGQIDTAKGGLGSMGDAAKQLGGKLGIPTELFTKMGPAVAGAAAALKVAKDAFLQTEGGMDAWGAACESAKASYSVFLNTLNNGNWSGFFTNLKDAITGANKLYDAMDRLSSIKQNNMAAIAKEQATIQELRLRQEKGENVAKELAAAEERLKKLQMESVEQGKVAGAEQMKQTITNSVNSIKGNGGWFGLKKDTTTKVTEQEIDAAIQDILEHGQQAMDKYAAQYKELQTKGTKTITNYSQDGHAYYTKEFDITTLSKEEQGLYKLAKAITDSEGNLAAGIQTYATALQEGASANREARKTESAVKKEQTEAAKAEQKQAAPEGSIAAMREQLAQLNKDWELAVDDDSRAKLKEQIDEVSAALDKMTGKAKTATAAVEVTGPSGYSQEGISALRNEIQGGMKSMQMGSSEYMVEAARLVDLSTFENLLKTAVQAGIEIDPTLLETNFEKIDLGVDVSPEEWQVLTDTINEQLKELGLDPIVLDVTTGGVEAAKEGAKSTADAWQNAVAAVNNVGSALQQIEDPAAKVAGIVMQAVANIALGFAQAVASPATGAAGVFGWIAAATAGLATMVSTIAAVKSATSGSYASGGIIPGNSYSGDNLTANVNSGELILNRSQQDSIASQLTGNNPMQNLQLSTEISGTNLRIVMNNDNRSKGGSRGYYANIH